MEKHLLLYKQNGNPASNTVSAATQGTQLAQDVMNIKSEMDKHLVNEIDCIFVKMHQLNPISNPIPQCGNMLNTQPKLPEVVMIDHNQCIP